MATAMAAHNPSRSQPGGPPKRPRLSVQTNISLNLARSQGVPFTLASSSSNCHDDSSNVVATPITSPTRLHTLSNTNAPPTSGPQSPTPLTAINTRVSRLQLDTSSTSSTSTPSPITSVAKRIRLSLKTATPHVTNFPETPVTAFPFSPQEEAEAKTAIVGRIEQAAQTQSSAQYHPEVPFKHSSRIATTPPLSAESSDVGGTPNFKSGFDPGAMMPAKTMLTSLAASEPRSQRELHRRNNSTGSMSASNTSAPYTHPRTLRSILRNSPLPPNATNQCTAFPRPPPLAFDSDDHLTKCRRPVKRVCYNTPLTQTITNNKYTVSHIDLLFADDDAASLSLSDESADMHMMSYTVDETRDGGSTPGPWADMQRRIECLTTNGSASPRPASSPSSGPRKRKRKEKTRRWVWTIGVEEEEEEDESKIGGAIAALRAAERIDELNIPVIPAAPPTLNADLDSRSSSPTPTPSMTSSTTADDDDDDDYDDDAEDHDNGSMDLDTPRAALPSLAPLHTPTFVSPAAPTGPRPALSLLVPGKLETSKLCPGTWNQPDSPLRRDNFFATW